MKDKTTRRIVLCCIVILTCIVCIAYYMSTHTTAERNVTLNELEPGVYAYEQTVISRVPADNYTIVTVCDDSGYVYTFKCHDVDVVYTNGDARAEWREYNIVNSTEVTLYLPQGSLKYLGAVGVH